MSGKVSSRTFVVMVLRERYFVLFVTFYPYQLPNILLSTLSTQKSSEFVRVVWTVIMQLGHRATGMSCHSTSSIILLSFQSLSSPGGFLEGQRISSVNM